MTPKEEAIKEIDLLLQDTIDQLPLIPASIKRRLLKKTNGVAIRIMNLSEKYVKALIAQDKIVKTDKELTIEWTSDPWR